jgi:RNA polymerase sigma-70 factor (ECF subfamily)
MRGQYTGVPFATRGPAVEPEVSAIARATPDRAAFDALYRVHAPFVWRSLRRLGVRHAALDDATQEVFVVVHRRFAEFRAGPTEKAWLFAIAQRVASDQRRWVRRKGNLSPLHDELVSGSASPLDGAITREASDLVLAFLEQLDEPRRNAFILADLEQMTCAEAGETLGVNPNTVYYRLAAARKAFVAFLESRGVLREGKSP